jgi:lipopolysaccharide/colanic/teichoic acid biosynthesis glycosyltransferase
MDLELSTTRRESQVLHLKESRKNGYPLNSPSLNERKKPQQPPSAYFCRKTAYVRALATLLLIVLSPVTLASMALVRLTSRGPMIFRQVRVGKNGKEFNVLKIRTMYRDAESASGPVLCQPRDSRITPVGRILRFLHMDELPQLINVIRGEMCLVGPRPERPEIIAKHRLDEIVPGFNERTMVLPGVTGLAQVNLPADQGADCVKAKVQLDLEYIATANANLDLRILLCTAMRMLGVRHGQAVRLFGLRRTVRAGISSEYENIGTQSHVIYRPLVSHASPAPVTPPAHVTFDEGGEASASSSIESPRCNAENKNGAAKKRAASSATSSRRPR